MGLGGGGDTAEQTQLLYGYVLALTGKTQPRLLYVPTALADSPHSGEGVIGFYDNFRGRGDVSHLFAFPWPPADIRELVLSQDAICVSGGNTANMLAIWKVHGIDVLLREAWENGVVLWGASAGMICWFESGVTDSFGPQLEAMDCLGFVGGSFCPHWDDEDQRRPRYHRLIGDGYAAGYAADAGVGLHFVGDDLREVVACREGTGAYHVDLDGGEVRETQLAARVL